MPLSCNDETGVAGTLRVGEAAAHADVPVAALREVVRRYGTPTYAYDLGRVWAQVAQLRAHLPPQVEILYSLKANPSLGLCGILADCGLGADVASPGELVTARAAGFPPERTFLTGPDKSSPVLAELESLPGMVLSLDSVSELRLFAGQGRRHRAVLRLRPDFCSYATCSAGPDSRFGLTLDDLPRCRDYLDAPGVKVVGFHVFSGSQVLAAEAIVHHLRGGLDLALRAAKVLGLTPEIIDLGGGFGVPYGPQDRELDLAAVGQEMRSLVERAAPARLVVELGRYLVAQAGWYLTTVLAQQTHRGRPAVVVDGGTHQRGDLCGVGLRHKAFPPAVLKGRTSPLVPTDVLGCLSLPADVLAESALLPPLAPGDVLAFPNAGAYGLAASPCLFHGHVPPAEVAFDGARLGLLRQRPSVRGVLEGQTRLR
jgi:diaminopimelate decarboxylase